MKIYKYMKLFSIVLFVLLTSCKTTVQIFETNTTNTQFKTNDLVYENDTLKITYNFWAKGGLMSFTVYNKLEKPIYIDWKNSAFIYNDNKLNYWSDEAQTKSLSYYGAYYYIQQATASSTFKPERVTFIPPKSQYNKTQFYLMPVDYKLNNHAPICKASVVPRNDRPKKKTTVYSEDFSFNDSPLRFRNYLAFSFSENTQQFFFIDNGFYLKSVKEMDTRHCNGKYKGYNEQGNAVYEKPFKKPNNFYKIPNFIYSPTHNQ